MGWHPAHGFRSHLESPSHRSAYPTFSHAFGKAGQINDVDVARIEFVGTFDSCT